MICPRCKITNLVVEDNNYFCPNCQIYIGSVDSLGGIEKEDSSSVPSSIPSPKDIIIEGRIVKVPKLILFIAWFYLIIGILQIIGSVAVLLLMFLRGESYGTFFWFIFFIPLWGIMLAINLAIAFFFIILSFGLRHLRKWAFIIYEILSVIAIVAFIYLYLFSNAKLNFGNGIGIAISVFIALYLWLNSALFFSKRELAEKKIIIDNKFSMFGKIILAIIVFLALSPALFLLFKILSPFITGLLS
ncbi:MAG: hypothetical protein Q7S82_01355 [bacterium]|nr:hypothetical protein [bacterium]